MSFATLHSVAARIAALSLVFAGALSTAHADGSQGKPTGVLAKQIRIIVPFTPGTGMDSLARLFAEQVRQRWGSTVVVDNRPGASGNIGSLAVAQAAPDGTTLMMTANTFVITPPLYRNVPYDVVKDFAPVGQVAIGQLALAVHPSLNVGTLREFIAAAKAAPGRIDYASPGVGTPQHLSMESLKLAAGISLTHIPYRGSAGAVQDLVGGTVKAMILPVHTARPLALDNRIRLLGVAGATRAPAMPQLATFQEQGLGGFAVDLWYGLYAPGRTPPEAIAQLNGELVAVLADPGVRETVGKLGMTVKSGPPSELAQLTRDDLAAWTRVINTAGIKAE